MLAAMTSSGECSLPTGIPWRATICLDQIPLFIHSSQFAFFFYSFHSSIPLMFQVGSILWSGSKRWVWIGLLLSFPASFAARRSSSIGESTESQRMQVRTLTLLQVVPDQFERRFCSLEPPDSLEREIRREKNKNKRGGTSGGSAWRWDREQKIKRRRTAFVCSFFCPVRALLPL